MTLVIQRIIGDRIEENRKMPVSDPGLLGKATNRACLRGSLTRGFSSIVSLFFYDIPKSISYPHGFFTGIH